MLNIFSEYLEDYWDKDPTLDHDELDIEMLVAFVDRKNRIVYPDLVRVDSAFCNETLGQAIHCHDMQKDKACGDGALCQTCPIRAVIEESFRTGEPAIKKVISKNLTHNGVPNYRNFQITTNFLGNDRERLLIIFDDVTKRHQRDELIVIENHLVESEGNESLDDMAQYLTDHLKTMLSSQVAMISIMSPTIGFSKHLYSSHDGNNAFEGKQCTEIVDRKIWLECLTKNQLIIDNDYSAKISTSVKKDKCKLERLLLAPIIIEDQAIGILIAMNKTQPYTTLDQALVEDLVKKFSVTLDHKQKNRFSN